jgi:midasin
MRKVIAYIASHFRKDKIWLRRSRPDKRRYQVRPAAGLGKTHLPAKCVLAKLSAVNSPALHCTAQSALLW